MIERWSAIFEACPYALRPARYQLSTNFYNKTRAKFFCDYRPPIMSGILLNRDIINEKGSYRKTYESLSP